MARPILAIIACNRDVAGEPAQTVMSRYVTAALRHADASGLIVPSLPDLVDAVEVAERLDGLLLTGSPSNVAPARYGDASQGDGPFDLLRDSMTARLTEAFLAAKKPVFGICRGLQELNIFFGGSLRRDVSAAEAPLPHHAPTGMTLDEMFTHGHAIDLVSGGLLERLYGRSALNVNSVHFQGVGQLGAGLTVEARAPDGLVEAFSANVDGAPVLAVQWHPEWDAERNGESAAFFQMLGRALRGQALVEPNA